MAVNIVTADPYDGQQSVTIDSKIIIEFDASIDPFTVENGISIYTPSPGLWTGPDLAILDTEYKDVLDITEEYTYFPFNWTIEESTLGVPNGRIVITPIKSLLPDRDYYLAIYPGDDSSRYLSKVTVLDPEYTLDEASTSLNSIDITSAYTGTVAGRINMTVTSVVGDIVTFSIANIAGDTSTVEIDFSEGSQDITIDTVGITLNPATWTLLDAVTIDVVVAEGVSELLRNKFTTTHLEASDTPSSTKINTLSDVAAKKASISLVSSIPSNLSINNIKCNPITLVFNQAIDEDQDINSRIKITKKDINSGVLRQVTYFYKINGATIKLYLTSLV